MLASPNYARFIYDGNGDEQVAVTSSEQHCDAPAPAGASFVNAARARPYTPLWLLVLAASAGT
jgi:hypothetical protein